MLPERAVGERRQINLVELGRPGRGWHGQCKFQPTVLAMLNAAMHADRASLLDWQAVRAGAESQACSPGEADRRAWERQAQGCNRSPLRCDLDLCVEVRRPLMAGLCKPWVRSMPVPRDRPAAPARVANARACSAGSK